MIADDKKQKLFRILANLSHEPNEMTRETLEWLARELNWAWQLLDQREIKDKVNGSGGN